MEKSADGIKQLVEENYTILNDEQIKDFNRRHPNGDLNNVVVGLDKHCFGLFLEDDGIDENYVIFYCVGIKLEAHLLKLSIHHSDRESMTFYFSHHLTLLFPELDTLEVFNTFQKHLRSCCEMLGYLTINPDEIYSSVDSNPLLVAVGVKGIIKVRMFEKATFYKDFFGERKQQELIDGQKYIYLMLNKRNNHFKIGSSKQLLHREKTLQSEEPEIDLITFWCCPVSVEKALHKQYREKRKRGEWFDLTLKDLSSIKEQMQKYK